MSSDRHIRRAPWRCASIVGALLATAQLTAAQTLFVTATVVEDLAWSSSTGRLYAALPAGFGGPESGIAELNPDTGAILARVAVANGPGGGVTQLAVSDDGSTLYAGVDGGRSVRRYALPQLIAGAEFSLGTDGAVPWSTRDLTMVPGSTATLVVSRTSPSRFGELVVYDQGVARPDRVTGWSLQFFSATQAIDAVLSYRYRLVSSGLVADTPRQELLLGQISTVQQGIGYVLGGVYFDLGSRQVLGSCAAYGLPVPMLDLDHVLSFGSGAVESCRWSTFTKSGVLPLAAASGYGAAIRTGTGRVALLDQTNRLVVAAGFDMPLPAPPPPRSGFPWSPIGDGEILATLTGCVTCRAGDTLSLAATVRGLRGGEVEVKAAIVLPNGAAIGATALGTSHLVLRNLYNDASASLLRVVLPAGLPTGRWAAELALIDPGTGAVLSRSSVPFEVQP